MYNLQRKKSTQELMDSTTTPRSILTRSEIKLPEQRFTNTMLYRQLTPYKAGRTDLPLASRPAAWRLLKLFPATSDSESSQPEAPKLEGMDMSSSSECFIRLIMCSLCRKSVQAPFFHRNTCHAGDYDAYLACCDGGLHCKERHHLFVETENTRRWTVAKK